MKFYWRYVIAFLLLLLPLVALGNDWGTKRMTVGEEIYLETSDATYSTLHNSQVSVTEAYWSSSSSCVRVRSDRGIEGCVIYGYSTGTATVTFKCYYIVGGYRSDSMTHTYTVVVNENSEVKVTSISLNTTSATMYTDDTEQLSATVYPSNATNKSVSWSSSNNSVATVSSSGLVTAKAVGSATITCKANGGSNITASCSITVKSSTYYVTSISLNANPTTLYIGDSKQFSANVYPSYATNQSVSWSSSNTSVATISSSGLVTAKAEGTTTITCKANDGSGVKASLSLTVSKPIYITTISLNSSIESLDVGATKQLSAEVYPSDATNKSVTWSSSNTNVATISSTGLVTAIAEGTVTITCKANDGSGVKATCKVTVNNVYVTSISLNTSTAYLYVDDTKQLSATVNPSTATDKSVTWSSSNTNVATVSSTGLVTAIAEGTATITCKANDGSGVEATCNITVYEPIKVESISINPNEIKMLVNDMIQLKATVSPYNAVTDDRLSWSSNNNSVATVSSIGMVTAIALGAATITCTAQDGSGVTSSCEISVIEPQPLLHRNIKSVSAGYWHTMMLMTDGTLWACGRNRHGQLGDGTTTDRTTPSQVMTDVAQVSAGAYHTMILKSDSTLWACGYNNVGQLGDGTETDKTTPVQVMGEVAQVSAGYYHTMILKTDGTLWACGSNYYGELGDGTTTERTTPVKVMTNVAQVSAEGHPTMILKTDGALWACGSNFYGQLGDGTNIDRITPVNTMIGDTDVSKIDNVIYARRATNCAGGQSTLSINMKNSVVAESFQFDLYLPDGVSFVMDEDGFPEAYLSTERTTARKTNMFESTLQADGSLRVYAASSNGSTFSGNDGEVATVNVKISDSMEAGEYFMFLKNIVITDNNAITYEVDSVRTTLEVLPYALGRCQYGWESECWRPDSHSPSRHGEYTGQLQPMGCRCQWRRKDQCWRLDGCGSSDTLWYH